MTLTTTGGADLRGFVVDTGPDWFAFELEASHEQIRVRYDEVAAVYHEHPLTEGGRTSAP